MVKVTTTYNGARRVYDLGQRTLVLGPTGSGKTTLLASLGLLLTGVADDAVGRAEVANAADLTLAMAEDQESIEVRWEGEGTTECVYHMERGKRPVVTGVTQDPWRHPVRALRAILSKGADSARMELSQLLLGDAPVEVRRLVPPQVAELIPHEMSVGEIAERLGLESTGLKAKERDRKSRESALDSVERMLPARPSPEAIEAARRAAQDVRTAALTAAEDRGAQLAGYQQAVRTKQQAEATLSSLVARGQKLQAEYQQVTQFWATYQPPVEVQEEPKKPALTAEQVGNFQAYQRLLGYYDGARCPLCSQPAVLQPLRSLVDQALQDHAAAQTAPRPKAAEPNVRRPEAVAAEYQQVAESANAAHAALTAIVLPPEPPAVGPVSTGDAEKILGALEAAEQQWSVANSMRAELNQLREDLARREILVGELKRLLDQVYRERAAAAEDGVSRWLPKGHRLVLVINPRQFRLGLRLPDGTVATNPSGGQRSALLLAMAVYLLEQQRIPSSGPVVVMLPEERGFSAKWLGLVMTSLQDAPCPIVLVSLVKPTGYRGHRWVQLDLEKVQAETVASEASEDTEASTESESADFGAVGEA